MWNIPGSSKVWRISIALKAWAFISYYVTQAQAQYQIPETAQSLKNLGPFQLFLRGRTLSTLRVRADVAAGFLVKWWKFNKPLICELKSFMISLACYFVIFLGFSSWCVVDFDSKPLLQYWRDTLFLDLLALPSFVIKVLIKGIKAKMAYLNGKPASNPWPGLQTLPGHPLTPHSKGNF